MNAKFSNNEGSEENILMGCYGIGVGRILAACIEANAQKDSMNLPISISPFSVYLAALQTEDDQVMKISEKIYQELSSLGIDVLFDDRPVQPGVKFNDSDLLALPYKIVVSRRNLENKIMEIEDRDNNKTLKLSYQETINFFKNISLDI